MPAVEPPNRWPFCLGALSVALACAEAAYWFTDTPERYAQFTVGWITWRAAAKSHDFILLTALVGAFAVTYLALVLLDRRVSRLLGGDDASEARALIAYATLPAVVWASGLVLGPSSSREFLWLGATSVLLSAALIGLATTAPFRTGGHLPTRKAGYVLLMVALGALSPWIAVFAINRWSALVNHAFLWATPPGPWIAAVGSVVGLAFGLWIWSRGPSAHSHWRAGLIIAQCVLPWAFMLVVPTPWVTGSTVTFGVPTGPILASALVLVSIAYVDLIRRLRPVRTSEGSNVDPVRALSPVALGGALLFCKLGVTYTGLLDGDDYHFGENLVPWWSLVDHGSIPFWDYVPARGLINYVDGAIAALMFGHTAADIVAAAPLIQCLTLLAGMVTLSLLIGVLPAAGAFLMMPILVNLNQVDIFNTAALAVLLIAYSRVSRVAWIVLWISLGTVAFLLAPAQGGALVVATTPLGIWQVFRATREQPAAFVRMTGALVIVSALLLTVTPLGRMIIGAMRYAVENSAVASAAHGVEWAATAEAVTPLNRWLWEAIRTSWIAVGLTGLAALTSAWILGERARRDTLLLTGVPVVLLAVVFIYRAASRIDAGSVSRPGFASIWMGALLLPVLLRAVWGDRRWPAIVTINIAVAGLLSPVFAPLSFQALRQRTVEVIGTPPDVHRATALGLHNVGAAWLPPENLARLQVIKRVLDVLLDPGETYLDLRNRNAEYFYLDRRLPIESGALYNLPNDSQQLRAIRTLTERPVPVLAGSGGQLFDGGPPSLRTYAIYRYLLWRYVPVKINDIIFLLAPERLHRLDGHTDLRVDTSNPAEFLDGVFRYVDLEAVPVAWGDSWATLQSAAIPVHQIAPGESARPIDATALGGNQYQTVGRAPSLQWALSLDGRDAGLLTFDFSCPSAPERIGLEVTWGVNGSEPGGENRTQLLSGAHLVVPLDAAPRWLLARSITSIRIRIMQPERCPTVSIGNLEFWQRRITRYTDQQH